MNIEHACFRRMIYNNRIILYGAVAAALFLLTGIDWAAAYPAYCTVTGNVAAGVICDPTNGVQVQAVSGAVQLGVSGINIGPRRSNLGPRPTPNHP